MRTPVMRMFPRLGAIDHDASHSEERNSKLAAGLLFVMPRARSALGLRNRLLRLLPHSAVLPDRRIVLMRSHL